LRYDAFIGRWIYFHKGHLAMVRKVYDANKRPILIMVMNTDEEPSPFKRAVAIKRVLDENAIPHKIKFIPPIASINWGRDVGYETNHIVLDSKIEKISSTRIKKKIECGMEVDELV